MLLTFNNYGQLSFLFIYFIISKYYLIFDKIRISFTKNKSYTVILFSGSALFPSEWFPPSPASFLSEDLDSHIVLMAHCSAEKFAVHS